MLLLDGGMFALAKEKGGEEEIEYVDGEDYEDYDEDYDENEDLDYDDNDIVDEYEDDYDFIHGEL